MKLVTLYQRAQGQGQSLTPELRQLYAGDLTFPAAPRDRPYVIGNFVQTIDGVVSFGIPGRSGGEEISGGKAEDLFTMGLLRSMADAVIFGAGSLRAAHGHLRIPEFVYPEATDLFAELRAKLGKPPLPLNVILTASGEITLDEPTFHTPGLTALIITTKEGASRLASRHADRLPGVLVRSTGESKATTPTAVLNFLAKAFGVRLLLHEGGPTVFGQFIAANVLDELFLTLAPQIAGGSMAIRRPNLTGEALFLPETAPWFSLQSVKQASDHLLLRYASSNKAE